MTYFVEYTLYDQIGTPKLGRYQNSGKINGTLDINCLGRLGQQFTILTIYNKGTNVGGNEREHERNEGSVKQRDKRLCM